MFDFLKSESEASEQVAVASSSRRGFLRKGTVMGLLAIPLIGVTSTSAQAQVLGKKAQSLKSEFRSIQKHENAHVQFILTALGSAARPKPTFRNLLQRDFRSFVAVSQALENTGVGAYLNALPNISSSANVAAAGSIALVEARHAGFLNNYQKDALVASPANSGRDPSFDAPLTPAQVRAAAGVFIASLNGGPPVDYTPGNDISILNYALVLEYLEADFYNVNVPKFY